MRRTAIGTLIATLPARSSSSTSTHPINDHYHIAIIITLWQCRERWRFQRPLGGSWKQLQFPKCSRRSICCVQRTATLPPGAASALFQETITVYGRFESEAISSHVEYDQLHHSENQGHCRGSLEGFAHFQKLSRR